MRRKIGYLICLLFALLACNKTVVTLTAEEILERDINTIDEYLASQNIEAVKLENGVRYRITELGTGATVTKDNCIRFKYAGYEFINDAEGVKIDTAFEKDFDNGLKTPYKSLVPGMQVGMKYMPVGTKGTIYIPSAYGYSSNGSYSSSLGRYVVHPNTPIMFDVEIVDLYAYNALGNYCYEQ